MIRCKQPALVRDQQAVPVADSYNASVRVVLAFIGSSFGGLIGRFIGGFAMRVERSGGGPAFARDALSGNGLGRSLE